MKHYNVHMKTTDFNKAYKHVYKIVSFCLVIFLPIRGFIVSTLTIYTLVSFWVDL